MNAYIQSLGVYNPNLGLYSDKNTTVRYIQRARKKTAAKSGEPHSQALHYG